MDLNARSDRGNPTRPRLAWILLLALSDEALAADPLPTPLPAQATLPASVLPTYDPGIAGACPSCDRGRTQREDAEARARQLLERSRSPIAGGGGGARMQRDELAAQSAAIDRLRSLTPASRGTGGG